MELRNNEDACGLICYEDVVYDILTSRGRDEFEKTVRGRDLTDGSVVAVVSVVKNMNGHHTMQLEDFREYAKFITSYLKKSGKISPEKALQENKMFVLPHLMPDGKIEYRLQDVSAMEILGTAYRNSNMDGTTIYTAPEFYHYKEGLNSRFYGLRAAQNMTAWTAISLLLDNEMPKHITEIGCGHGGLTLLIGLWAKVNGATFCAYDKDDVRQLPELYEPLDINFVHGNYGSGSVYLADLEDAARTGKKVLCLCDGGDKLAEFHRCIQVVAPGDVVMVHDYRREKSSDSCWGWCEATLENFVKYPVTPVYERLLEKAAWGAFRKNQ